MTLSDQFLLALQAYQEIRTELHQGDPSIVVSSEDSNLQQAAGKTSSLPDGSILLGLAEDGLPLLLDLYEPAPGPLLVVGDAGSGKTAILQSLARLSYLAQDPGDIQFSVLTPFPEEWTALETLPNCMGVWPAYHPSGSDFLSQLVSWANTLPETRQVVLLLLDGLDLVTTAGVEFQHDLRWLLMYGPERHIWPVVTVSSGRLTRLEVWLKYFSTHILGQVKQAQMARWLMEDPQIDLAALIPGSQFSLSQPNGWMKFWLPPLE